MSTLYAHLCRLEFWHANQRLQNGETEKGSCQRSTLPPHPRGFNLMAIRDQGTSGKHKIEIESKQRVVRSSLRFMNPEADSRIC